jgi:hypothetical protein
VEIGNVWHLVQGAHSGQGWGGMPIVSFAKGIARTWLEGCQMRGIILATVQVPPNGGAMAEMLLLFMSRDSGELERT